MPGRSPWSTDNPVDRRFRAALPAWPAACNYKPSSEPNDLPRQQALSLAETVSKTDRLSDDQRECTENCQDASEVCERCADACLGDADMAECAETCRQMPGA